MASRPFAAWATNRHVRFIRDEPNDPLAEDGMVVNRKNANRAGIGTHDFICVSFRDNFSDSF